MPRNRHSVEQIITKLLSNRSLPEQVSYRMEATSITRWSKTVGAGGIGSMRRGIRCWKG